jgi:hypothetical protein
VEGSLTDPGGRSESVRLRRDRSTGQDPTAREVVDKVDQKLNEASDLLRSLYVLLPDDEQEGEEK